MDLAVSPLFAGLATSTLDEILDRMKPRRYAAGEAICREGEVSDRLYLIESGVGGRRARGWKPGRNPSESLF